MAAERIITVDFQSPTWQQTLGGNVDVGALPPDVCVLATAYCRSNATNIDSMTFGGHAMTADDAVNDPIGIGGKKRTFRLTGQVLDGSEAFLLTANNDISLLAVTIEVWRNVAAVSAASHSTGSTLNISTTRSSAAGRTVTAMGTWVQDTYGSGAANSPTVENFEGSPGLYGKPYSMSKAGEAITTLNATISGGSAAVHHWSSWDITGVSTPPALTDPTVASVTSTSAQVGVSVAVTGGSLRRLTTEGLSVPDAATIKSTGTASTPSATGAQGPFATPTLTPGLTYRTHWVYTVDSVDSAVVSSAPFYPGTWRPISDRDKTGWVLSSGTNAAALLNEDTPNATSEITHPDLASPRVVSFNLDKSKVAGNYIERVGAFVASGTGTVRVTFRNDADEIVGESADQAITSTPTVYDIPVTLTGIATRGELRIAST